MFQLIISNYIINERIQNNKYLDMNKREEELITTLYNYYVDGTVTELKVGDYVKYTRTVSKHSGKIGTFEGTNNEGKYKIRFDDIKILLICNPQHVESIKKDEKSIDRLIKILKQMVLDGDLSQVAINEFLNGLNREKKLKEIDPYDEENWEEEEKGMFLPKRISKTKSRRTIDPFDRSGGFYRGC